MMLYGGVAQLARAFGSYPTGHRFKSHRRYQARWSSGLRHRPFTAVTRVRISYGSPLKQKALLNAVLFVLCRIVYFNIRIHKRVIVFEYSLQKAAHMGGFSFIRLQAHGRWRFWEHRPLLRPALQLPQARDRLPSVLLQG